MANYRRIARRTARRRGLDPAVFERQIQQESGFNPRAHSPAGAQGIAQIMPATARGWGVNPDNPRAALDAAAKNMKRYVDQFGSYDKALRAYNAGPGNVERSRGFSETNNYVRTILGGRSPSTSSSRRGGRSSSTTTTTPGVDNRVARAQLIQSFLSDKHSDPLDFAVQAKALRDVAPTRTTTTHRGRVGARDEDPIHGSEIKELFWQGPGGIDLKNGKRVPQGFVSGHRDHVHVAAGPKTVVEFGKLAQRMGLHVGENSHFGGRPTSGHAPNSYHYRDQAIDVSSQDVAKMRKFAHRVARYQRTRR